MRISSKTEARHHYSVNGKSEVSRYIWGLLFSAVTVQVFGEGLIAVGASLINEEPREKAFIGPLPQGAELVA